MRIETDFTKIFCRPKLTIVWHLTLFLLLRSHVLSCFHFLLQITLAVSRKISDRQSTHTVRLASHSSWKKMWKNPEHQFKEAHCPLSFLSSFSIKGFAVEAEFCSINILKARKYQIFFCFTRYFRGRSTITALTFDIQYKK
jgi:hypothetical protein